MAWRAIPGKKDLQDQDNYDGVITHLEPDILECEVKWALESIIPETRRPLRSWVTSVETGSVWLDCVLSSRSVVFGSSWRWVRI